VGGPPAWGLDGRVTTAHRKNAVRYDTFYIAMEVHYVLWSPEVHYLVKKKYHLTLFWVRIRQSPSSLLRSLTF
jgi:hypothetical protein